MNKLLLTILSLIAFVSLNGQSVTNGGFTLNASGWGCSPEINVESVYGGISAVNKVAEIDAQAGLCQTVSGLIVGQDYILSFDCSRRTTCGPAIQSMNVELDGGALNTNVVRNGTPFQWVNESFCFTATSSLHVLTFAATINGTCGLIVDNISISMPQAHLGNDTALCQGNSINLNVSTPSATYLWNNGSTLPTLNVNQAGTYWVEVNVNGCIAKDTVSINFNPYPQFNIGNDTTLCFGDSVLLSASVAGAGYNWSSGATNSSIIANQTGVYWVDVTVNNCTTRDSLTVNHHPQIPLNLGNDTALCDGEILTLDISTANGSYLWSNNSSASTLSVNQTGNYWAEVEVNGCKVKDTIDVTFHNYPQFNLGNDTTLCQGDVLQLNIPLSGTYLWDDNSTNSTHTVTQQGIHWVDVTVNNCTTRDSIEVNFNPVPVVDLGNDTTLCDGQSLSLSLSIPGAVYLWSNNSKGAGTIVSQTGTYWAEATVNGCKARDSIQVSFISIPTVDLGNDTSLCEGQAISLSSVTSGASYLWSDNSTNATLSVHQSGTYWLEVTIQNCSARDSVSINTKPVPVVDLGADTFLCKGTTLTLDATQPNATYLWNNGTTAANIQITDPGDYWVKVTVDGCSAQDFLNIHQPVLPAFSLGNDTSLCEGKSVILSPDVQGVKYLWSDQSDWPELEVFESGTHWLKISNQCESKYDSILIQFENCDCQVYIPNAFTPNGDNLNDGFAPKFDCQLEDYQFLVYSRWGDLLFQTTEKDREWDGIENGNVASDGVYAYTVKYVLNGERKELFGKITLVR